LSSFILDKTKAVQAGEVAQATTRAVASSSEVQAVFLGSVGDGRKQGRDRMPFAIEPQYTLQQDENDSWSVVDLVTGGTVRAENGELLQHLDPETALTIYSTLSDDATAGRGAISDIR
jgi:hypothetical protein